jgi:NADH-quinone oxidoreductase subunit L
MVWGLLGSLNFSVLSANTAALGASATLAGLLIFCGAMGKSAQFPLHVWLPDAMEGPTPVSALIHAATMVAAGVYMLCRSLFLFDHDALQVISYIGGFTALLAALMAVQQNDIKRIIAYSTLSQLGYMVMAVGLSGPTAAMFHLTTHAFFKALLFLAAGSVILGMHHEQDIWHMGNLRKKMPITFITFTIGALALSGIPPFAGFYSKDSIFAQCLLEKNYLLFAVAVLVAGLTAFYTFRLFFVVFFGKEKSDHAKHAHESPLVMTAPLIILAVFAFIGGFIGINGNYGSQLDPHNWESAGSYMGGTPNFRTESIGEQLIEPLHAPVAMCIGIGVALAGIFLAFSLYKNADTDPLPAKLGALSRWMADRFYFDELYEATVIRFHDLLAAITDFIDRWILEGAILGAIRGGTDLTGRALRLVQTGNLQTYAFLFVFGVAVLLYFVLVK